MLAYTVPGVCTLRCLILDRPFHATDDQLTSQVMNGRHFSGMVVEAYIADGSEKFKKTSEKQTALEDDGSEDEGKRLDQFGEWLEEEASGGTKKEA